MWGRYLEIGGVWCGSVSRSAPRLIMSGASNGCLCLGRAASLTDKSPPELFKCSLNWNGFWRSEWIPGCKFKTFVELRQIDLCKRIKKELLERQRKCVSWQRLCFRSAIRPTLRLDSVSFNICCVRALSLHHSSPLCLSSTVPPEALISCLKSSELDKGHGSELPGGRFRPKSRSASICMYQKSKW